ncbi:amino acid transporter [Cellulophaga sp. F20128]|uniref:amino acid transporter n=1 Tax=Cellulophaga sp. F20128 TaxID=2926413 RepID=UPI001FF42D2A|nr:amino acid transporter [Cellulophaga sp. F20128]MCK0157742.1 amino acid transporter [Cellulophaga sp. F20128]
MNQHQDYFRISKKGDAHTLSDRIPIKGKELIFWNTASIVLIIYFLAFGIGIFVAFLSLIGYSLYRLTSWIYSSEIEIEEKSRNLIRLIKILERTQKAELIAENFDPNRFDYSELTRSGASKFVMNYRTHKNNQLLIIKNKTDKEMIKKYITEKINILSTTLCK